MISEEFRAELERLFQALEGLRIFQNKNEEELEKLKRNLAEFTSKGGQAYYELSKYGWYLNNDSNPGMVLGLVRKLKEEGDEALDEYMIQHYRVEQNSVYYRLVNRHPKRAKIVEEAFGAYNNHNYYSAICLLLTQVDGICYDVTKRLFFKNERGPNYRPQVEKELKKSSNQILELFITPISTPTTINEHTDNLLDFPTRLNRHAILHGLDTEYGTEANCLKIISFVGYIDDVLNWL